MEEKIPFDIDLLNKITSGGLARKSLAIFLAATGVGKTLVMCHIAAATLKQCNNVLYITMEMSAERIAERIDANLMNLSIDELIAIDRESFNKRIIEVKNKTHG